MLIQTFATDGATTKTGIMKGGVRKMVVTKDEWLCTVRIEFDFGNLNSFTMTLTKDEANLLGEALGGG